MYGAGGEFAGLAGMCTADSMVVTLRVAALDGTPASIGVSSETPATLRDFSGSKSMKAGRFDGPARTRGLLIGSQSTYRPPCAPHPGASRTESCGRRCSGTKDPSDQWPARRSL